MVPHLHLREGVAAALLPLLESDRVGQRRSIADCQVYKCAPHSGARKWEGGGFAATDPFPLLRESRTESDPPLLPSNLMRFDFLV